MSPTCLLSRRSFLAGTAALSAAMMPGAGPAGAAEATGAGPTSGPRIALAQAQLAGRLFAAISPGSGSVLVSPASLAGVLSTIGLGGDAAFRSSLAPVLGLRPSLANWADLEILRRTTATRSEGPVKLGNAVAFDRVGEPWPSVIPALRAAGVRVSQDDLTQAEGLAGLNRWAAEQTAGLIPTVVEDQPGRGGLVAVNVLHFADRWRRPFDQAETRATPFQRVSGGPATAQLMRLSDGSFRFRRDGRFVAVDLPYATPGLSFTAVTSRGRPLSAREFGRVASWLAGHGFADAPGEVHLPRLQMSRATQLLPVLRGLGLDTRGGLPGFVPGRLVLSQVRQKVVLALDEAGTRAAAATTAIATRSLTAGYVNFIADRPFLFAVREEATGLLLVAGYVGSPD